MIFEHDRHGFFVLVRKHFSEPADATGHSKHDAQDTDRRTRRLCSAFFTDTSVAIFSSSAAQNVNNSENYNPHGIHEMPVQGEHVDPRRLLRSDAPCQSEEQHDAQHD